MTSTVPLLSRTTTYKAPTSLLKMNMLLAQFLNGQNANNKVNRWSLELSTYNITFEWISGAKNKAADCLSRLVKPI